MGDNRSRSVAALHQAARPGAAKAFAAAVFHVRAAVRRPWARHGRRDSQGSHPLSFNVVKECSVRLCLKCKIPVFHHLDHSHGDTICRTVRVRAPLATEASVVMSEPLDFTATQRHQVGLSMDGMLSMVFLEFLGKPIWIWLIFIGVVLTLLVLDLGVLNRRDHVIGVGESLKLSAFYIAVAMLFGGWVWYSMGSEAGLQYYTGFFVEKSLSLDNVFVISLIFSYFAVPRELQHRVLFWGILGVIVLRGLMIGAGAALVSEFHWILYIFGAFLVLTGIKMLFAKDEETNIGENAVLRFLKRRLRVTDRFHGPRFVVKEASGPGGAMRWAATPLLLALIMVELADLVFAVDSVPAIFAITTDPYLVYTSNIFAVLGLRALYFALAAMVHRFRYLKYALALVLVFIGGKIFYTQFFGKPDPLIALGVTFALIGGGVLVSLWKTSRENKAAAAE
ncbi:TerC family protein [Azospirillum ramasamyi]